MHLLLQKHTAIYNLDKEINKAVMQSAKPKLLEYQQINYKEIKAVERVIINIKKNLKYTTFKKIGKTVMSRNVLLVIKW